MSKVSRDTPSRLEAALVKAAMRRFRAWKKTVGPVYHDEIVKGGNNINGGKLAGDLIRACTALERDRA